MRLLLLCLVPALAAIATAVARSPRIERGRVAMLVGAAAAHLLLTWSLWRIPTAPTFNGWLGVDPLGLLVLTLVSVLFFATAVYAVGYLRRATPRGGRVFVAGLLGFLSAMSVVALSQHLALLWVGLEATTFSVAPLIYHRHDRRSLEAVWKYLLVSSVGIALALLGLFFLATAQDGVPGAPLILGAMVAHAHQLQSAWLRTAFLFLVVGFGTKMGLAPMHTWKPDTYGEAPALVGALMAGALTSCAFLGVARVTEIAMAAGLARFVQPVLIGFGLVSLTTAAVFMIGQGDLKRILAYSSVENMGLLALGLGLGGVGAYGSVLHMLNNGLAKGWLFLVAGNVALATGSAAASRVRGLVRAAPVSGVLLVAGFFAICGSPPFGPFLSEFTIIRGAVSAGHPWVAGTTLTLLLVIFVGMAVPVLRMTLGEPEAAAAPAPDGLWLSVSPAILAAAVLGLGLYIPSSLQAALASAASALGGRAP